MCRASSSVRSCSAKTGIAPSTVIRAQDAALFKNAVEIVPDDLHHVVFRWAELGVEVEPDFFFVFHVNLVLGNTFRLVNSRSFQPICTGKSSLQLAYLSPIHRLEIGE